MEIDRSPHQNRVLHKNEICRNVYQNPISCYWQGSTKYFLSASGNFLDRYCPWKCVNLIIGWLATKHHKSVVLALHQCKSGYLSLKNIILSRYVLKMLARTPFVCVKYLFPHFPCRAWTFLVNFCPWDLNLSASSASAASDFVEPWLLMAGTTKIAVFSRHHDCTGECPRLHGLLDCVKSIQTSPINPAPFPAKCW